MKSIFIILTICLFFNYHCFGQTDLPLLQEADAYFYAHEFASAAEKYDQYVKRLKTTPSASLHLRWAYACYKSYQYAEALKIYQKTDSLKQIFPARDRFYYGLVHISQGNYSQAKEQFRQYGVTSPSKASLAQRMIANCDSASGLRDTIINPGLRTYYRLTNEKNMNSRQTDYAPVFNDGKLVFISRRNPTRFIDSTRYSFRAGEPLSYYYCFDYDTVIHTFLSPVRPFSATFSELCDYGPIVFSKDGRYAYFTRNVKIASLSDDNPYERTILKIYQAENVGGFWKNIKELPFNGKNYSCGHPALSQDGNTLYFASDAPKKKRKKKKSDFYEDDFDIFKVTRTAQNKWNKKAERLPETINTEGNECFPYIDLSGRFYFASNFHPGLGGYDLFEWTKDGKIVNLKKGINSESDDIGLLFTNKDQSKGFISSNRKGGKGYFDIYSFSMDTVQPVIPPKDSLAEQLSSADSANKAAEDALQKAKSPYADGTIPEWGEDLNQPVIQNNPAIPALIRVHILERAVYKKGNGWMQTDWLETPQLLVELKRDNKVVAQQRTDTNGYVGFNNQMIGNYDIVVKEPSGYVLSTVSIASQNFSNNYSFSEIILEKIVVPVYFDLDKHHIRNQEKAYLDQVKDWMKDRPSLEIQLAGHTCPLAPDYYNMALSERRANAVYEYLKDAGVEPDRMNISYFGEKQITNNAFELYPINRRCEVIVRSKAAQPLDIEQLNQELLQFKPVVADYIDKKKTNTDAQESKKLTNESLTAKKTGEPLKPKPVIAFIDGFITENQIYKQGQEWKIKPDRPLAGLKIILMNAGKNQASMYSDRNGRFSFRLREINDYEIIILNASGAKVAQYKIAPRSFVQNRSFVHCQLSNVQYSVSRVSTSASDPSVLDKKQLEDWSKQIPLKHD